MERLQKVIASSGYVSRRKAEELITSGKVFVNGEKVTLLGTKVSGEDDIVINGVHLKREDYVYFLLNKPRGVISSASDEFGRKTVVDLIDTDKRIYPVGRLDYDTTGLLLLTNDGELSNLLMHPKNNIDKVYVAKINGFLSGEEQKRLKNGVIIENFKTSAAKVKVRNFNKKTNTSIVEITIHEGKNHQVKKMFEAVGHEVLKLKREKIAFLNLQGLNSKEYRSLTIKEVKQLYNLTNYKK